MAEGKFDEAKGRAKETVGDVADDDELKAEGKVDRASGEAKSKMSQLIDKVKEPFQRDA